MTIELNKQAEFIATSELGEIARAWESHPADPQLKAEVWAIAQPLPHEQYSLTEYVAASKKALALLNERHIQATCDHDWHTVELRVDKPVSASSGDVHWIDDYVQAQKCLKCGLVI